MPGPGVSGVASGGTPNPDDTYIAAGHKVEVVVGAVVGAVGAAVGLWALL